MLRFALPALAGLLLSAAGAFADETAKPAPADLGELKDAVAAARKRGDNVDAVAAALSALEKALAKGAAKPPGPDAAPPELAALRGAVEAAMRKGENLDAISKELARVEKALTGKEFERPKAPDPVRPTYRTPPPLTKEIVVNTTDAVQVPRVYLVWRAPASYTADEPSLDLAASILADGKSSRLYKRLVYDEKIAQNVRAYYSGEQLAGTFRIVATAKPGVDPQRLIKEISEEVAKLSREQPTAAELERAQNSHEAGFLDGLEPTLRRAIQLAGYDVQAHDPDYFAKDLARYRAVTAAQVHGAR